MINATTVKMFPLSINYFCTRSAFFLNLIPYFNFFSLRECYVGMSNYNETLWQIKSTIAATVKPVIYFVSSFEGHEIWCTKAIVEQYSKKERIEILNIPDG